MDNFEFANRIIELRKQKGISQKELGEMLGVSNKAVSKWENGESMPKTSTMLKLAEILGIDGNELIGFEVKDNVTPQYNNAEIDKLKSENAILTSKLNSINKRRKQTLIAVIIICIVGIIASGIIAFCFSVNNDINSNIEDVGENGTKIVFSNESFIAPNEFQSYIIVDKNFECCDKKYAEYYDLNGKEHKALIECYGTDNYIKLSVGNKEYYYVNSKIADVEVNIKYIDKLFFEHTSVSNSAYHHYPYDSYLYNLLNQEIDAVNQFCEFYQNKGNPVDKKITQIFLGNEPVTANVLFNDKNNKNYTSSCVALGEFFKDDKGNVYFYDYITTSSYSVGKELSEYVYKH